MNIIGPAGGFFADTQVSGSPPFSRAYSWVLGTFADSAGLVTGFETGAVVPIPTALPLFATGLVGLVLLGWRRKRKAQAV
jgi:hypothetical protein